MDQGKRRLRILLVEDDRGDMVLTRDFLRRIDPAGFELAWVEDLEAAESAIRAGEPDVYLVDYRLGADNGLEFLKRRAACASRVPVIMLTGQDERHIDFEAMKAGAVDFLVKGRFDAEGLARAIRYAVERAANLEALARANEELEKRVEDRTRELAALNESLSRANERLLVEVTEKQRLYELALQAGRMRDEFLATVTHELRSPLNVIGGYVTLLELEGPGEPRSFQTALDAIKRSVKSQTVLIGDLLDASSIVTGKMRLSIEDVELERALRAALDTVRFAAQMKDVRFILDLPAEPVRMKGDESRLQQIFWNLLSNAIKFSHPGGTVWVSLVRRGDDVEVSVRDKGVGIAEEFLPHVFDRFRQEEPSPRRSAGGLGLGLAIARHVTELHGGRIEALSGGRNQGAAFVVTLPCRTRLPEAGATVVVSGADEDGWEAAEGRRPPARARQLEGITLTLLEDEEDTRQLYAWFLQGRGARVLESASAAEALANVRTHRPHVILSDIGMPGEDGISFLRKVRALPEGEGGRTPAIALTAYGDERMMREIREAGFDRYIHKPVALEELATSILEFAGRAPGA